MTASGTLATGLPATTLTGLDLHQLDSYKEFHCLITDSPFPRFPQRDRKLAECTHSPMTASEYPKYHISYGGT